MRNKTRETIYKIKNKEFKNIKDIASHYGVSVQFASKMAKQGVTREGDMIKKLVIRTD